MKIFYRKTTLGGTSHTFSEETLSYNIIGYDPIVIPVNRTDTYTLAVVYRTGR